MRKNLNGNIKSREPFTDGDSNMGHDNREYPQHEVKLDDFTGPPVITFRLLMQDHTALKLSDSGHSSSHVLLARIDKTLIHLMSQMNLY